MSRGKLAGVITRGDMLAALETEDPAAMTVLDAGTSQPAVAYPEETLRTAVDGMLRQGIGRLPVVSRDDPPQLVGYLGRTGIMQPRAQQIQDRIFANKAGGWDALRQGPDAILDKSPKIC